MIGGWIIAAAVVSLYLLASVQILGEYERGVVVRMSLRIEALEVPAQDVETRDNVTVKVNAVIFFPVIEPRLAVLEVSNYLYALLSQRGKLNLRLQSILDQHTASWGMKVTLVEVKQVELAEQMIRAIARQAEAERERRAKVIQQQPAAIQLRYLQTLVEIGSEHNTTIAIPRPIDLITSMTQALNGSKRIAAATV